MNTRHEDALRPCPTCSDTRYTIAGFVRELDGDEVYTVGEYRTCAKCGTEYEQLDQ